MLQMTIWISEKSKCACPTIVRLYINPPAPGCKSSTAPKPIALPHHIHSKQVSIPLETPVISPHRCIDMSNIIITWWKTNWPLQPAKRIPSFKSLQPTEYVLSVCTEIVTNDLGPAGSCNPLCSFGITLHHPTHGLWILAPPSIFPTLQVPSPLLLRPSPLTGTHIIPRSFTVLGQTQFLWLGASCLIPVLHPVLWWHS